MVSWPDLSRYSFTLAMSLIDPDVYRKAALTMWFMDKGWHVEPYEGLAEFDGANCRSTLIIVFDTGDTVEQLINALADRHEVTPVVAYSDKIDPHRVTDAVLHGAVDYFSIPFDWSCLAERLERVMDHQSTLPNLRKKWSTARKRISILSKRERQVFELLSQGCSNRQIATHLDLSPKTVDIHRANMMSKLNATHVSHAVTLAVHAKIFDDLPQNGSPSGHGVLADKKL